MEREFSLIFEGRAQENSDSRLELAKVLKRGCGFSRLVEIDHLLDSAPFTVKTSSERQELEVFSRELRQVGARVMIVEQFRPRMESQPRRHESQFAEFFRGYADKLHAIMSAVNVAEVEALVCAMQQARQHNRQIFIFGNGGSAALASHMATDLAKERFVESEALFRVQSLNDNMSWFTATANDFGYDKVFVNQLKNLLQPEDLVIAISSSGNSPNVVQGVQFARQRGARTWGLVGFDGGALLKEADHAIYIPTKKGQYGYMEDVVSLLVHIITIYLFEQDCKTYSRL
jgi:D-sedoheptulose 7-phosphate isomerase